MENIVRLDDTKTKLLKIIIEDDSKAAMLSTDGGDIWTDVSFESPIVQNNLFRFENNKKKLSFFTAHVGHKIRIDNGNPKGYLIIKSLENISFIPDEGDILSINYTDIDYEEFDDNLFELKYNLVRKQTEDSAEFNREKYENSLKESIENGKPISPLEYQGKV